MSWLPYYDEGINVSEDKKVMVYTYRNKEKVSS
jgi:hypothetical protein